MDPVITVSISICMSLLFGVAAAHKMRAPETFRSAIDDYRLVPRSLSGPISICLLIAESLVALMVLIPAAQVAGLAVMAGLLLLYTGAICINLNRGRRDLDCGCSGPASRHLISGWLVLRNLILLGLVLLALLPPVSRPLNWMDLLVIVFGVLTASGLYLGMNQLLAQSSRLAGLRNGA